MTTNIAKRRNWYVDATMVDEMTETKIFILAMLLIHGTNLAVRVYAVSTETCKSPGTTGTCIGGLAVNFIVTAWAGATLLTGE